MEIFDIFGEVSQWTGCRRTACSSRLIRPSESSKST